MKREIPGRSRVTIEGVSPEVDGGRYPVKGIVGEKVVVEADIFSDGHDTISAVLQYRKTSAAAWDETPMNPVINDRWQGFFRITEPVNYVYTVTAWMDKFKSWRVDLLKRVKADQDITVHLLSGARLISEASHNASGLDADALQACAETMESAKVSYQDKARCALAGEITLLMDKYQDRRFATTYQREVEVSVEREKARFSAWYEMFPRSCSPEEGRHGTFKDCENMLPYVASMGFDVLYLPPVHPIGESHRKGKNNTSPVKPGDPGSPWAIGSPEGGHKAIHPELGTIEDFRHLVGKARENNIEIALDLAFQCSPDHPYVKEHPEWFNWRPDGTIQYAENPPKKYQDIYPINFDTEQWQELWDELKSIVVYWAEQGIRFFRVDNPHTKPFPFWEWLIKEIKKDYPDVLLLAEAFTRPKVMLQLARLGFTQSYTYFAWRNTKAELTQYFTELNETDIREYFRPNLWINTPDILTEYLQFGGRTAFISRLVLAAMLGASYGIYGPAFELCENRPREQGSEEYLDSEKYELKHWDISRADSLKDIIARVNRIRLNNPALQSNSNLRFHEVNNEQLVCFSKSTEDFSNTILVVVNLDPNYTQSGWVELPLEELGLDESLPYQMHDLLSNSRYLWSGPRNYIEINPLVLPAHIFQLRRRIRTERDFDYFM